MKSSSFCLFLAMITLAGMFYAEGFIAQMLDLQLTMCLVGANICAAIEKSK